MIGVFIVALLFSMQGVGLTAYDPHFGISGLSKNIELFSNAGIKWAKMGNVAWGIVEPEPPKKGIHRYDWSGTDRWILEVQQYGINLKVILHAVSEWGTTHPAKRRKGKDAASAHPGNKYIGDYQDFISNIVERYDGDGKDDMPGLKVPVKYWQIGSEVHNRPMWAGTVEEYLSMLKLGYESAKKADPDSKIILAEFGFSGFFCDIREEKEIEEALKMVMKDPRSEHTYTFIKTLLRDGRYFDIVSFHPGHCYNGIPWAIKELNKEMNERGYKRPIWIGDMASGPFFGKGKGLTEAKTDKYKESEEEEKLNIMESESHPKHKEVEKWYRKEQARLSVKKPVVALAHGAEKIFLANPFDWSDYYLPSFRYFGLLDRKGNPRPAFYAYKLLIEKVGGFSNINILSEKDGRYIYRFLIKEKNREVYLLWNENGEKEVRLSPNGKRVRITNTVAMDTGIFSENVREISGDEVKIDLNSDPLIVEVIK